MNDRSATATWVSSTSNTVRSAISGSPGGPAGEDKAAGTRDPGAAWRGAAARGHQTRPHAATTTPTAGQSRGVPNHAEQRLRSVDPAPAALPRWFQAAVTTPVRQRGWDETSRHVSGERGCFPAGARLLLCAHTARADPPGRKPHRLSRRERCGWGVSSPPARQEVAPHLATGWDETSRARRRRGRLPPETYRLRGRSASGTALTPPRKASPQPARAPPNKWRTAAPSKAPPPTGLELASHLDRRPAPVWIHGCRRNATEMPLYLLLLWIHATKGSMSGATTQSSSEIGNRAE